MKYKLTRLGKRIIKNQESAKTNVKQGESEAEKGTKKQKEEQNREKYKLHQPADRTQAQNQLSVERTRQVRNMKMEGEQNIGIKVFACRICEG